VIQTLICHDRYCEVETRSRLCTLDLMLTHQLTPAVFHDWNRPLVLIISYSNQRNLLGVLTLIPSTPISQREPGYHPAVWRSIRIRKRPWCQADSSSFKTDPSRGHRWAGSSFRFNTTNSREISLRLGEAYPGLVKGRTARKLNHDDARRKARSGSTNLP
jgi:hypothetical protein